MLIFMKWEIFLYDSMWRAKFYVLINVCLNFYPVELSREREREIELCVSRKIYFIKNFARETRSNT